MSRARVAGPLFSLTMLFDSDDFALFGLPRRFALERADLDARRRTLQAEVHPDRFASSGAAQQRLAMQWAVRVNEAYERLKDPLKRASYLCELGGAPIAAEDNTAMPAAFLMDQIEWREALDEARSRDDVEAIARRLQAERDASYATLGQLLDEQGNYAAAAQQVRALMFTDRLNDEVEQRLDSLPA
jgi:molecular chaperone HscB